jgi:hypothetical protein
MLKDASDQEIKDTIRTLAKAVGLSLSEERIEVVLPQFKANLEYIATVDAFELPLEAEPSTIFQLSPKKSATK